MHRKSLTRLMNGESLERQPRRVQRAGGVFGRTCRAMVAGSEKYERVLAKGVLSGEQQARLTALYARTKPDN